MSPGHFAPGGSTHATIPFPQSPGAAFPATADASGLPAVSRPRPPRRSSGVHFSTLGAPATTQSAPCIEPCLGRAQESARGSPSGKIMLSAENIGRFLFETRFGPGMLLEKPGHRLPLGAGSEPGQGGALAAPYPPHGARGSAPPQASATTPTSCAARPATLPATNSAHGSAPPLAES